MSNPETGGNLDNSTRQLLTGWKLWSRLLKCVDSGETLLHYYKERAFPVCPACGSPNVMVCASRKGHSYLCLELDCKNEGQCEVQGSDGIEQRRAKVRVYVVAATLLVLITVLFLTGHLPDS